jgi:SAM-dependent methyltransferase
MAVADPPIADLAERLERERLAADRRYNEALTQVDHAIQADRRWPPRPPDYDATQLPSLNAQWRILPEGGHDTDPVPTSLRRSIAAGLRRFIWRIIGPPLQGQQAFNGTLVDHLNRNRSAHEQWPQIVADLLAAQREEFAGLQRFQSLLVQYLLTVTEYVDSKDRSLGGPEWRERLALAEQRLSALTRDVSRSSAASSTRPAAAAQSEPEGRGAANVSARDAVASASYVVFEDRFRGAQREIRDRAGRYVPVLRTASDVLDVGCGRGEMIELLREQGVAARGVDPNPAMVEVCRSRGLQVDVGDAVSYLERQADASIGGLVSIQVVEHFDPAYLTRFLELAFDKLRPGAPLVLETLNPACWMAFFECYLRDVTHRQALHPDTLKYLVQAAGFSAVDVHFCHPVRDADRLEHVPTPAAEELARLARVVNDHADKLNARLFAAMDYAVIARR